MVMWDPDVPFCSLGGVLCGDPGCCGDSGAVSGGWMEEKNMVEILQCGVRVVKRYAPPIEAQRPHWPRDALVTEASSLIGQSSCH